VCVCQDVLPELMRRTIEVAEQFIPQNVSNMLWALATAGMTEEEVQTAMEKRAVELASEFVAQGPANILWAYAKMSWVPKGPILEVLPLSYVVSLSRAHFAVAWPAHEKLGGIRS